MSDTYKLVFRGEVLEGQHPAVVRKRLGESAGFGEEALDKLFSGRPVVVKREADTATAAKFQVAFKKAGARLRVLPVETADEEVSAAPVASPAAATPPAPAPAPGFELLPTGSDLLSAAERSAFVPRDVDTTGLRLEGARFTAPEPEPPTTGPDVSHLSVAAVGSDLGGGGTTAEPAPSSAPDFDLAQAGADLAPRRTPPTAPVDFAALSFEVAPAGADLGEPLRSTPPPAPDVSHLTLEPGPAEP